jgi:hypothetical protein
MVSGTDESRNKGITNWAKKQNCLSTLSKLIRYNDMISIMTTYGAVFKWMRFLPLVGMTDSF